MPPGLQFNELEQRLYDYICQQLKAAGIEHLTQTSPKTGWVSPTPWAEDEKRLKMELGQWLPKACLTIPSFTRVRKDSGN